MKAPILALPAALLLFASGCRKTPAEPECAQVSQAPATFLAYWYFPKGSYWVYHKRGSNPVEVDTVTVIGTELRVFQPGQTAYGLPTCTELYTLNAWHSNRRVFRGRSSFNDFRGLESFESQEENGQWFVCQSSEAGNLIPLGFLWSYPQRPMGQPIANTGPTLLDTIPVTVPAGRFPRSVHLRFPVVRDSSRGSFARDYHLTRGVGCTRVAYTNLGTWELIAYRLAR